MVSMKGAKSALLITHSDETSFFDLPKGWWCGTMNQAESVADRSHLSFPQRQWPGDAVEMEMATVLEQCPSIVRFGYHFTQQGPRARAAQAMTRNNELRE